MLHRFFFSILITLTFSTAFAQNEQLQFDGTDDFCNVPNAEVLFSNLDVFTFEAWLNTTDISNFPIFIGGSSNSIIFGLTSSGAVAFTTSTDIVYSLPGKFPADGIWHHVACVRTGPNPGQGKIYIDGIDQTDPAFNTPGTTLTLSGDLTFGVGLTTFFLNGAMDEIRIWSVERSQANINNNMNVELAGNEAGLIGYWKFNEGSGQEILDSQTNGTQHNGTLGADNNPASDDPTRIQDPALPLPVELVSLTSSVNGNTVELSWITGSEINNLGFDVERKSENSDFTKVGFVSGNGTTTEFSNYSFIDVVSNAGTYYYRLKQIDFDGTSQYSNDVSVEVETIPMAFSLQQNYPNPFNPSTKIKFSLAAESNVTLTVFDIMGQEVANLINGNLEAGSHEFNFDASNLNSGVYFYRINTTGVDGINFSSVKKMILSK